MTEWLVADRCRRLTFDLLAGDRRHFERAIQLNLPETDSAPRLLEVDAAGRSLDEDISVQRVNEGLLFHLKEGMTAGGIRHYQLYCDPQDAEFEETEIPPGPLKPVENLVHEGFASIRIATPRLSWIYHVEGGGFAGLIDGDGANWISYHPWGGSDGNFRGIPNLVHPESYFHPGRTGCSSEIVTEGPLRVVVRSRSSDDAWLCEWTIEPDCARLAVLRAARSYWLLYEGTPGGCLDEEGDFILLADGRRVAASERWEMDSLPEPGWIAFGAANSNRALWLWRHAPDGDADSYWPMESNMTVFGYGRSGLRKSLARTPAHFSVGLAECNDHGSLADIIVAGNNPPEVRFGRTDSSG